MDEKTRLLDLLQGDGDIRLTSKDAKAILGMIRCDHDWLFLSAYPEGQGTWICKKCSEQQYGNSYYEEVQKCGNTS